MGGAPGRGHLGLDEQDARGPVRIGQDGVLDVCGGRQSPAAPGNGHAVEDTIARVAGQERREHALGPGLRAEREAMVAQGEARTEDLERVGALDEIVARPSEPIPGQGAQVGSTIDKGAARVFRKDGDELLQSHVHGHDRIVAHALKHWVPRLRSHMLHAGRAAFSSSDVGFSCYGDSLKPLAYERIIACGIRAAPLGPMHESPRLGRRARIARRRRSARR